MTDVGGATIPFVYRDGGNLVVTALAPRSVVIPPRHDAFVTLDKAACVLGTLGMATAILVTPPGQPGALRAALPFPSQPTPGYCGASDPGSVINVSPIEPTIGATLQSH